MVPRRRKCRVLYARSAVAQATIDKAIELSLETKLEVHFLFIVNLDFLRSSYYSHMNTIEEEINQMGEFILLDVISKSAKKGIVANSAIRKGKVSEEIIKYCQEIMADFVILGKPKKNNDKNVLSSDTLDEFAENIESQSGVKGVYSEHISNDEEYKFLSCFPCPHHLDSCFYTR